jgi:hypothetical protein
VKRRSSWTFLSLLCLSSLAFAEDRLSLLLEEADQLLKTSDTEYTQLARLPLPLAMPNPNWQIPAERKITPQVLDQPELLKTKRVRDPRGMFDLRAPDVWEIVHHPSGVLLRKHTPDGGPGVFGIRRMRPHMGADAMFGKPTVIDGLPATRVDLPSPLNPDIRNVEYFVQPEDGAAYYIVMRAHSRDWDYFEADFDAMLKSLSLR